MAGLKQERTWSELTFVEIVPHGRWLRGGRFPQRRGRGEGHVGPKTSEGGPSAMLQGPGSVIVNTVTVTGYQDRGLRRKWLPKRAQAAHSHSRDSSYSS